MVLNWCSIAAHNFNTSTFAVSAVCPSVSTPQCDIAVSRTRKPPAVGLEACGIFLPLGEILIFGFGGRFNRDYSQWIGREELFERERGSDPDSKSGRRAQDFCSLNQLKYSRHRCPLSSSHLASLLASLSPARATSACWKKSPRLFIACPFKRTMTLPAVPRTLISSSNAAPKIFRIVSSPDFPDTPPNHSATLPLDGLSTRETLVKSEDGNKKLKPPVLPIGSGMARSGNS
jgi:hypothetical protein